MIRVSIAALLLSLALPVLAESSDEVAVAKAMDALAHAIIAADKANTGKSVYKTLESSKQTIAIVGDVAMVRNHMSADIAPGGKPGHVELEMLYICQKRGGEWKLIARQAVKI